MLYSLHSAIYHNDKVVVNRILGLSPSSARRELVQQHLPNQITTIVLEYLINIQLLKSTVDRETSDYLQSVRSRYLTVYKTGIPESMIDSLFLSAITMHQKKDATLFHLFIELGAPVKNTLFFALDMTSEKLRKYWNPEELAIFEQQIETLKNISPMERVLELASERCIENLRDLLEKLDTLGKENCEEKEYKECYESIVLMIKYISPAKMAFVIRECRNTLGPDECRNLMEKIENSIARHFDPSLLSEYTKLAEPETTDWLYAAAHATEDPFEAPTPSFPSPSRISEVI